jgi:hypothetical protein
MVRRTRMGGDSWDAVEVPLAEEAERYEVDILDGTTVKRTLATISPSATYTAAPADRRLRRPAVLDLVARLSAQHRLRSRLAGKRDL